MEIPKTVQCFSCGAHVPEAEGATHTYMRSSPACWAAFGEVLAREYGDAAYRAHHRLTVDAYAVQHPGDRSRAAVRSVALHLVSLCALFEEDATPGDATRLIQRLAEREEGFDWLRPPDELGAVTVADVLAARGPEEHLEAVERWARSAWEAWSAHHGTVRRWLRERA